MCVYIYGGGGGGGGVECEEHFENQLICTSKGILEHNVHSKFGFDIHKFFMSKFGSSNLRV